MSDSIELKRGFLFACTNKTEKECFERLLFGAERTYGPVVIRIRKGDLLFLNNLSTDVLIGIFQATSNGKYNIKPDAWNGKYPYQVNVEVLGKTMVLENARKILKKIGMGRYTILSGKKLIKLLDYFMPNNLIFNITQNLNELEPFHTILAEREKYRKNKYVEPIYEVPPIEATTFWDFP
ncbi:hypothetical protein KEJ18_02165 [Candidatus Bathyarchaeota archaeon]|nr:hypothetical protein [Candidatus Bathyarchaeota archaeon]